MPIIEKWKMNWDIDEPNEIPNIMKTWKSDTITNKTSEFIYNLLSNRLIANNMRSKFDINTLNICQNCGSPNGESESVKHLILECETSRLGWSFLEGQENAKNTRLLIGISTLSISRIQHGEK